jgi:hypothetical protein
MNDDIWGSIPCNKCHNKKVTPTTTDTTYGDDDWIITGCDYKCFEDMSMNTDEDCDMYDPEEDEIMEIERRFDNEQFSEL